MAKLIPYLKASSLMEIVVAMVIISIISSISLVIYLNTMSSMHSGRNYQLESKATFYVETYEDWPGEDKEGFVDGEGNRILIEIKETNLEDLRELELTLTDSLYVKTIIKRRLIYQPDEGN